MKALLLSGECIRDQVLVLLDNAEDRAIDAYSWVTTGIRKWGTIRALTHRMFNTSAGKYEHTEIYEISPTELKTILGCVIAAAYHQSLAFKFALRKKWRESR